MNKSVEEIEQEQEREARGKEKERKRQEEEQEGQRLEDENEKFEKLLLQNGIQRRYQDSVTDQTMATI